MNTKVKITAAVCSMFLATVLLLDSAQAEKTSSVQQQKVSLTSSNPLLRYRGECKGAGVCMEDSSRVWYGKWHEY